MMVKIHYWSRIGALVKTCENLSFLTVFELPVVFVMKSLPAFSEKFSAIPVNHKKTSSIWAKMSHNSLDLLGYDAWKKCTKNLESQMVVSLMVMYLSTYRYNPYKITNPNKSKFGDGISSTMKQNHHIKKWVEKITDLSSQWFKPCPVYPLRSWRSPTTFPTGSRD